VNNIEFFVEKFNVVHPPKSPCRGLDSYRKPPRQSLNNLYDRMLTSTNNK